MAPWGREQEGKEVNYQEDVSLNLNSRALLLWILVNCLTSVNHIQFQMKTYAIKYALTYEMSKHSGW